jgi:PadR family transcriptional regulator, regulatory protein PadR
LYYKIVVNIINLYLVLQGTGRRYSMADTTQMLKGILDGCLLSIIKDGEIYGYELAARLESYGFTSFSEGTIYPLLLRMQKEGLVSATLRKSTAGPKRKYYSLTEKGEGELESFIKRWEQLSGTVNNVLNKREM